MLICFPFLTDVHPYSLCEKLGPKYASISAGELNTSHDFYKDLLRYQKIHFLWELRIYASCLVVAMLKMLNLLDLLVFLLSQGGYQYDCQACCKLQGDENQHCERVSNISLFSVWKFILYF